MQEYDLEIKPTKSVKGQGLAQILMKGNENALGINFRSNHRWFPQWLTMTMVGYGWLWLINHG